LRLYFEARNGTMIRVKEKDNIRTRICIKVTSMIRIRFRIKVTSRIQIRIKLMRTTTLVAVVADSNLQFLYSQQCRQKLPHIAKVE
jgi:hypothetical protein